MSKVFLEIKDISQYTSNFTYDELIEFFQEMPYEKMVQIYNLLHERINIGKWPI